MESSLTMSIQADGSFEICYFHVLHCMDKVSLCYVRQEVTFHRKMASIMTEPIRLIILLNLASIIGVHSLTAFMLQGHMVCSPFDFRIQSWTILLVPFNINRRHKIPQILLFQCFLIQLSVQALSPPLIVVFLSPSSYIWSVTIIIFNIFTKMPKAKTLQQLISF